MLYNNVFTAVKKKLLLFSQKSDISLKGEIFSNPDQKQTTEHEILHLV